MWALGSKPMIGTYYLEYLCTYVESSPSFDSSAASIIGTKPSLVFEKLLAQIHVHVPTQHAYKYTYMYLSILHVSTRYM